MTVHDFNASLRKSHEQEDAPWWETVYRRAFPDFACMHSTRGDGWWQRGGIDRVVLLKSSKQVTIDEKVREKDWPDFALEYWSDHERRVPGWVAKPLACDFISYAFVPSETCYLLPALALRRAWIEHGKHWVETCRRVAAKNRTPRGEYTTVSVAVPIDDVLQAVESSLRVTWTGNFAASPRAATPEAGAGPLVPVSGDNRGEQ